MVDSGSPVPVKPGYIGELRDTERAIALWHQKSAEYGGPPPLAAFDFSRLDGGDCAYRFVICADLAASPFFLVYGVQFARLLELPKTPSVGAPLADHLPQRYLRLFNEGCEDAIARAHPVPMSGFVAHIDQIELYRAAFMPLARSRKSTARFVLGSFNRRIGPRISDADAVRQTRYWTWDNTQEPRYRNPF